MPLGAKDYIVKPVQSKRLIKKLRKIGFDSSFFTFDLNSKHLQVQCAEDGFAVGVGERHLQLRASYPECNMDFTEK